jgi:hypothetical protein
VKIASTSENEEILCVAHTTEVAPQAEQLLEVTLKIQRNSNDTEQDFLVEPLSKFEYANNMKVALSLTKLNKEQLIVRVINPNKEVITIHQDTEIAKLTPILEKTPVGLNEDDETYNKEISIRYIPYILDYKPHF